MQRMMSFSLLALMLTATVAIAEDGWETIFDGKTFKGWKAVENPDTWKIKDGAFVCDGPRSHLFYVGDEKPFKNFEFKCDVMTTPGSNAGVYFHTKLQEAGWPKYGYEAQVNNTHKDPKKTGSLYAVENVLKAPAKDNEWWSYHITVKGKHIVIKVNDKVTVDYTEPDNKAPESDKFERRLGEGTFCFQGHDPKSIVYFKNVKVKRLP